MLVTRKSCLAPAAVTNLKGRRVLITGGTGSFGYRFVQTLLEETEVARLIVYSRDEYKQLEMQRRMQTFDRNGVLQFCIGDVRDKDRLEIVLRGIDTVVHAAALKQVPAAESNPSEFIHTNILGAENVVHAAMRAGVEKVLALSTDKAVNPVNLYGASKLASDKLFIAANIHAGRDGPRFSVVRYGNVLDSRGSVVPLFKSLAAGGATHLPITDERMTRFWITLAQSVAVVCSCLQSMNGGETFVGKIPSMKVTELARAVAPGLSHKIVGVRPGEKLHEILITEVESRTAFDLGDRYMIEPAFDFRRRALHPDLPMQPLPADFRYASDANTQWLTARDISELLLL